MKKKIISIFLIFSLLSSCAGMTDWQRTMTECTVTYTALGTGIGGIIGQLLGRNAKGTLMGLAIGAVASGIISGLYCNHVADKKAQYASEQQYLKDCIGSARSVNYEVRQYNALLSKKVSSLNREINALKHQRAHKKYKLEQIKSKLKNESKSAAQTLVTAESELKIQREVRRREQGQSRVQLAKLDKEINTLNSNVALLNRQIDALASTSKRVGL